MTTLHLPAIPHTVTHPVFSHCAFTGKVQRFAPMMRNVGYNVVHYGVDGSQSGATEDVVLMDQEEHQGLLGHPYDVAGMAFVGKDAKVQLPVYTEFNSRLGAALRERLQPGDILCLPFGHAHDAAWRRHPLINSEDREARVWVVETGIGYPDAFAQIRAYESYAWLHHHLGKEGRGCSNYEYVIPNYFNEHEWKLGHGSSGVVLYFGRIVGAKGLDTFVEMARARPDLQFLMVGQGDPEPYLVAKNISYAPPMHGTARSRLLGEALCVVMPTRFTEPFGGVAVEAQLTGTPVLASPWGAFTETIAHGKSGFLCHTLGDYLAALERVEEQRISSRHAIRARAIKKYSTGAVGKLYRHMFQQVTDLRGRGYLELRSPIGNITRAQVCDPLPPRPSAAEDWHEAQRWERNWWMNNPELWQRELAKQQAVANLMGLSWPLRLEGKRVVDIGCGPFSLLLRTEGLAEAVAVDPLSYDKLEHNYTALGIRRVVCMGEDFEGTGFDEAWMYNVLQHTKTPSQVLATLGAAAQTVRIFEWLHTPVTDGHLHTLTAELFEQAFPEATWRREQWDVGHVDRDGLHGDYLAAVLTRIA